MSSFVSRLLLGVVCLVGLAGCAKESLVVLEGRLTADSQPLDWKEASPLEVVLRNEKANLSFSAPVETNGRFTVKGSEGKGIPPGAYQITLRTINLRPGKSVPPPLLKGVTDPASSPLKYDVTADPVQRVVLDIKKQTVQHEP